MKSVKRLEDTWELTYTRTDTNENDTVYCDFVVVAIGQYNKPHVGKFSGLDEFEGKTLENKVGNSTYFSKFINIFPKTSIRLHFLFLHKLLVILGTVIHSHDYKCPETYKNSNVLVVGGGPSGLDIAIQLQKVAKKIVHSHHLRYNEPQLPENYVKKPDIKNFVRNGVFFNDTSFEELDHVILATGK